jgi:urease accessory protein
MTAIALSQSQLLTLLQLASPALPVGAYSYSEGVETLAANGTITTAGDLYRWLTDELQWGSLRVETAVMRWSYEAVAQSDDSRLADWNEWLSAFRETAEMRSQSWQMGRSLLRLFNDLEPQLSQMFPEVARRGECHYAIAYSLVTQAWDIPLNEAALVWLHNWAANLVSAAVRAVPLGQTEGQRLLQQLIMPIQHAHQAISVMTEADLAACSWGVAIASMQHEALYSRLFRS